MAELTLEQKRAIALARARAAATEDDKSFATRAKEFLFGDDDPTTQNAGEKIGTAINTGIEALTFGLIGDEFNAGVESALTGADYDERLEHYQDQEALLEDTNPGVALGAEVAGSLAGALLPMGAIGTLGRGAAGAAKVLPPIIPRIAASAVAGALGAGTYGFMEGEGDLQSRAADAVDGMEFGALVGAAAPVLGAGVQKGVDALARRKVINALARRAPSTADLRAQGNAAYQAVDGAGVQIDPQAFSALRQRIVAALQRQGLDELPGPGSLTPKAGRVLDIAAEMDDTLSSTPGAALPFGSLDKLRRQAGMAAADMQGRRPTPDAKLGSEIIAQLDDFIANLGPGEVVAGDRAALQSAIPKAREIWSRMSRSQLIDDAIEQSETYLGGAASGIRNQFARILRNPKLSRGFTDAEKKMLMRVVNGSTPQQLLTLLGGGLGQLGTMGFGAAVGNLPGMLLGAGAAGLARRGSEALATKGAETARAVIAAGGLPQAPQGSEAARRIIESLMRRTAAVSSQ